MIIIKMLIMTMFQVSKLTSEVEKIFPQEYVIVRKDYAEKRFPNFATS